MRKNRKKTTKGKITKFVGAIAVVISIGAGVFGWKYVVVGSPALEAQKSAEVEKPIASSKKSEVKIQIVSPVAWTELSKSTGLVALDDAGRAYFEGIDKWKLPPGKMFDYAAWYEKAKKEAPSDEAYSYLASLLYEASVKAGFELGERHLHQALPAYASPGYDVFAEPGGNGFSFLNPYEFEAIVEVDFAGGFPQIVFNGQPKDDWQPVTSAVRTTSYAPEQVEILDPALPEGTVQSRAEGKPGLLAIVSSGGATISRDFYLPEPTVVAHGPEPLAIQPAEGQQTEDQVGN